MDCYLIADMCVLPFLAPDEKFLEARSVNRNIRFGCNSGVTAGG